MLVLLGVSGRALARPPAPADSPGDDSIFAQSAAQILEREFSEANTSFILVDAKTGAVIASRWKDSGKPIPLGSLIKPFTALAYARTHQFSYPAYECANTSGCWLPRGHGHLGLVSAVANSCNAYFRMLAIKTKESEIVSLAREFGLDDPPANLSAEDLIGLSRRWEISPLHMAGAFLELSRRRNEPGVNEILAGMVESGRQGTGVEVGRPLKHFGVLVKTGTTVCTHHPRASADGFVTAMMPADNPTLLLMVRVHNVTGAKASATVGKMLNRIGD